MFTEPVRKPRRPSLTPMIDVVFLLLVFFMLASRFGTEEALPLPLAGGGEPWSGPPRLVEIAPAGLRLNGVEMEAAALGARLAALKEDPDDPVILRGRDGADLQRLVDVARLLTEAGHARLVLVE